MAAVIEAVRKAAHRLGFSKLRRHQEAAAIAFIEGNDVFVSLPTGSGKTVCFAILPFAFDQLLGEQGSLVIVASPFIG